MGRIFALIGIILLAGVGIVACKAFGVGVSAVSGIVDQTFNSSNIIYNYEWFKQQYADIVAIKSKISNAQASIDDFTKNAGPRTDWTFEDKTESSRLSSIRLGLVNQCQQMVSEYNAKSKMINRSIFKIGDNVPAELPTDNTVCS